MQQCREHLGAALLPTTCMCRPQLSGGLASLAHTFTWCSTVSQFFTDADIADIEAAAAQALAREHALFIQNGSYPSLDPDPFSLYVRNFVEVRKQTLH